jgi:hypothetical protein
MAVETVVFSGRPFSTHQDPHHQILRPLPQQYTGSGSNVCHLKAFLAIKLWDSIVGRVIAAPYLFSVTYPLLRMVSTGKMAGLAINNLGVTAGSPFLWKNLLPGLFLLPVLFSLTAILFRID